VEIVAALREKARARGLVVHAEIPGQGPFDAITAIDSLYYANDSAALLREMKAVLHPLGCLIVRVPNRTWLLDLMRSVGMRIGTGQFGDAKVNFSLAGIVTLLERTGFHVEKVIWRERGKADPRRHMRLFYRISPWLSEYLSCHIAPGMILVARPTQTAVPSSQ
jgi:hypothetical protein